MNSLRAGKIGSGGRGLILRAGREIAAKSRLITSSGNKSGIWSSCDMSVAPIIALDSRRFWRCCRRFKRK